MVKHLLGVDIRTELVQDENFPCIVVSFLNNLFQLNVFEEFLIIILCQNELFCLLDIFAGIFLLCY